MLKVKQPRICLADGGQREFLDFLLPFLESMNRGQLADCVGGQLYEES